MRRSKGYLASVNSSDPDRVPSLAAPSATYRASFTAALTEFAETETDMSFERRHAAADFDAYVRDCAAWSRGENLPDGRVAYSTFWLVRETEYLGTILVRHSITERMQRFGGHIGYIIRPSERRKGYGTLICQLGLDYARTLGLDRVLLTCADTNVASVRIIEDNGGVLQDKIMVGTRPVPTRRYWIELSPTTAAR